MSGNLSFASGKGSAYGDSGSNTVLLTGPSSAIATSYVLRLPVTQGNASQTLTNDGNGNLSWATPSTTASAYSDVLPIANGGTGVTSLSGTLVLNGGQSGNVMIGTTEAHNVALETAGVPCVTINGAGNVGIGTTAPAYQLDVQGTINGQGMTINGSPVGFPPWAVNGSNTDNTTAGNVGIGTDTPTTTLQVAGEISPSVSNAYSLGDATHLYTFVYATNGTIQTSDAREKKEITNSDLGLDFVNALRPVS